MNGCGIYRSLLFANSPLFPYFLFYTVLLWGYLLDISGCTWLLFQLFFCWFIVNSPSCGNQLFRIGNPGIYNSYKSNHMIVCLFVKYDEEVVVDV